MRSILGHVVVAVALAVAGGVCWFLGEAERVTAASHRQLALLMYTEAADATGAAGALDSVRRLPVLGSSMTADAHEVQATAQYWLGRYDALKPARDAAGVPTDHDAQTLLLAANAAYRVARASTADKATTVKRLNDVINSYADVLKSSPGGGDLEDVAADAAYNFEFVVRTRDQIVRQRGTAGFSKPDTSGPGATIHGHPGAPPTGVSMSEFRVVIPKRSDERQENPDAGRGSVKRRKG